MLFGQLLADPSAPLTTHTAFTEWQFAPIVTIATGLLAILYAAGIWRVRRRHPARPWPVLRSLSFYAGLAVVVLATQSSIGAYDDVLFSVHMVQHLMLIMIAPPLMVAGRPVTLLLHASRNPLHRWTKAVIRSRVVSALTCPPVAAVVYAAVIVGTHLTGFMNLTLQHEHVHDAEHVLYLVAGYLYFLPLLGSEPIRWKMSFPSRFLLLALSMPVDTFVGVVILQANHELFPAYAKTGRTWGPSLLSDLHTGGAIMWVGGDALMFVLMLCVVVVFLRDKRAHGTMGDWLEGARSHALQDAVAHAGVSAPVQPGRRGQTVDDDEHLAAYNAYLARLGGSTPAAKTGKD
ncbi:MAG TPA: cytochrome c oxidase assembly protein [Mycobacteriales bacterium]|jgi:putative copper resistance protein D|nr:cytochrome c oxidase assembly protein [Mycobacteriales bacterium]